MPHTLDSLIQRNRAVQLKNITCPYCGKEFSGGKKTKDHVIGRNFVPRGAFDQQWNLILSACPACNLRKSELEDDISAITASLNCFGFSGMNDELLRQEAQRRSSRSISRKTGKPVIKSTEKLRFNATASASFSISGEFTAPPQIEEERSYELARLQLAGFFYMLTYDPISNQGFFWPDGFYPLHTTHRPDWGNTVHRDFMSEISGWDYRLILITAKGYYKAILRRHPNADCWAWAVEWNKTYRALGFLGDRSAAQAIADRIRPLHVQSFVDAEGITLRMREEKPLHEADDVLFSLPEMLNE